MSDSWFKNMPSLGPNSIAPAPYKPPVACTLALFSGAGVGVLAFLAVLLAVWG